MKTTNPTYRSLTIFATYYSIFMCVSVSLGTFLSSFALFSPPLLLLLLFRIVFFFFFFFGDMICCCGGRRHRHFLFIFFLFFSFFSSLFCSIIFFFDEFCRTENARALAHPARSCSNGRLVVFLPFLYLSCIHSSSSSSVVFMFASSVRSHFIHSACHLFSTTVHNYNLLLDQIYWHFII